jgi:SAM-dependent MidA family methyltransferase
MEYYDLSMDLKLRDLLSGVFTFGNELCDSLPLPEDVRNRKDFRNSVMVILIALSVLVYINAELNGSQALDMNALRRVENLIRELVLSCFDEVIRQKG